MVLLPSIHASTKESVKSLAFLVAERVKIFFLDSKMKVFCKTGSQPVRPTRVFRNLLKKYYPGRAFSDFKVYTIAASHFSPGLRKKIFSKFWKTFICLEKDKHFIEIQLEHLVQRILKSEIEDALCKSNQQAYSARGTPINLKQARRVHDVSGEEYRKFAADWLKKDESGYELIIKHWCSDLFRDKIWRSGYSRYSQTEWDVVYSDDPLLSDTCKEIIEKIENMGRQEALNNNELVPLDGPELWDEYGAGLEE